MVESNSIILKLTAMSVTFESIYWNVKDIEGRTAFYLGGQSVDGQNVTVKLTGFKPYAYVELPTNKNWNQGTCSSLFNYFRSNKQFETCRPIDYKACKTNRLQYKVPILVLKLSFNCDRECRDFFRFVTYRKHYVDGIGDFDQGILKVHEHNIDLIVKLSAIRGLQFADWLTFKPDVSDIDATGNGLYFEVDYRKISNCSQPPKNVFTNYKYLSFDIECYSKNHNSKLPDPKIPENFIFSIAYTVGLMNSSESRTVLLTLFNPNDIPNFEIVRCFDEPELILTFGKRIAQEDPTYKISYNGMEFDWNYLLERAELLGILDEFLQMSRTSECQSYVGTINWSSKAYGEQNFKYVESVGRTNIDVLLEIKRNFKLPKYTLDAVAEKFLGEHKEDVTPRQLFMLVQLTMELYDFLNEMPPEKVLTIAELKNLYIKIRRILPARRCPQGSGTRNIRTKLLQSQTKEEMLHWVRECLTLTGYYNGVDTQLPVKLTKQMNLEANMKAQAKVNCIPPSYLNTKGMQIRTTSPLYRQLLAENIIIPYNKRDENAKKYRGAIVQDAEPGYHNNVASLDFTSLYPTMMIVYNICYTTIVADDDPIPDSECHVLSWEDHHGCFQNGCPFDLVKKKVKKDEILCQKHYYRFKKVKVVVHPDGRIEYQNQGILPRNLIYLLSSRKVAKKDMFKYESILKMHEGTASEDELAFFVKIGMKIIKEGELTPDEVKFNELMFTVANALQLAYKLSCNSTYGYIGASAGMAPLKAGAASVTATGRDTITKAINYVLNLRPGIAEKVYGDTDSGMIKWNGATLEESYDYANEAATKCTHYLKCDVLGVPEDYQVVFKDGRQVTIGKVKTGTKEFLELEYDSQVKTAEYEMIIINLEFENMYGCYYLLSKKRYITRILNRKGVKVADSKKGVLTARRDNCQYQREIYKSVTDAVIDELPQEEVFYRAYDGIHKLYTRQVPDVQKIFYVGCKNIIDYAKTKEVVDETGKKVKMLIDPHGEIFSRSSVESPLDTRLVYPNLPQVLLALKMIRRGDDVPPNTRLEFIFIQNPDAQHLGESAEDYTYYIENKDEPAHPMKPDHNIIIDKVSKQLTEALTVRFPRQKVVYEHIEDALKRTMFGPQMNELKRKSVLSTKKFSYSTKKMMFRNIKIGWSASPSFETVMNFEQPRVYNYKGFDAKIAMILHSYKYSHKDPNRFTLKNEADAELIHHCLRWKSKMVLGKLYERFGMTKRQFKHPSRTGDALGKNLAVLTAKEMTFVKEGHPNNGKVYPAGTQCKIVHVHHYETGQKNKKGEKIYTYDFDIHIKNTLDIVICHVKRRDINTFLIKDGTVVQDMLKYRIFFGDVVKQIDELVKTRYCTEDDLRNSFFDYFDNE